MMTQMQKLCRMAAAEGAVLLKNEKNALPIREGETVSIFGRIQLNYYKSGTGSGGLVNVNYVVDIPDGLRHAGGITVNEELYNTYAAWENDHPFDSGKGWAQEPFCQEEMPVSDELAEKAAGQSDLALVVLGLGVMGLCHQAQIKGRAPLCPTLDPGWGGEGGGAHGWV